MAKKQQTVEDTKSSTWNPTTWEEAYEGLKTAGHTDESARTYITTNLPHLKEGLGVGEGVDDTVVQTTEETGATHENVGSGGGETATGGVDDNNASTTSTGFAPGETSNGGAPEDFGDEKPRATNGDVSVLHGRVDEVEARFAKIEERLDTIVEALERIEKQATNAAAAARKADRTAGGVADQVQVPAVDHQNMAQFVP